MFKSITHLVLPLVAICGMTAAVAGTEPLRPAGAPAGNEKRVPLGIIKIPSPGGGDFKGTGVLVAKTPIKAFWLTAAHVVRGGVGSPRVSRSGQRDLGGVILKTNSGPDLCIIRTSSYTVSEMPIPIWRWKLDEPTTLKFWAEGYSGSSLGRRAGTYSQKMGDGKSEWNLPSIPGESGGPIYTVYRNQFWVCGITSTSDWPSNPSGTLPGETQGGDSDSIRSFLASCGMPVGTSGYAGIPTRQEYTLGGRRWPNPLRRIICPTCPPQSQYQYPSPSPPQGGSGEVIPEDFIAPQDVPQDDVMDEDELRDLIREIVKEEAVAGPAGPEGPRGPAGPAGDAGADGADGASVADVMDAAKPLLANAVINAVSRDIESRDLATRQYVDQRIQVAIQAAIDEITANPQLIAQQIQPHLDPQDLASRIQKHLDPIGLEFRDPSGRLMYEKSGAPMKYEQRLGGKFIFKLKPTALSVQPVEGE